MSGGIFEALQKWILFMSLYLGVLGLLVIRGRRDA